MTLVAHARLLNHFELKPGVIITATEAIFSSKKVKHTEESTGASNDDEVIESAPAAAPPTAEDTPSLALPSRSVILKHVWNPLDGCDAAFFSELEDDMRVECAKHGAVEHVQIVADGSVVVRFAAFHSAIACLKVMHKRWFAGRQIEAQFDPATAENPSDAETKVEAFLASLGE
ncbi:hypothetical protein PsorP6_012084 [Peronosclerospora sorghi]|uniref:Uncharacterized protein n=1 Tax=Peronosclerospora sorghi TaxID=230839 RepID=A0ACC0WLQ9_9STRA|nr:hypothetical protein PsorP6_012084 [Peronosclerospora sorghi]